MSEVESVLQASAFHGPQNERMEGVSVRLNSVEHHVVIHVPQQKMEPSLRTHEANDAVVLRHIVGVVSPLVFLR